MSETEVAIVESHALTTEEHATLTRLEDAIERGIQTFIEVGTALVQIRDGKLYRDGYTTFEAYLQERWGLQRRRAYQLIEAAGVVENVNHGSQILPANEPQTRELARLPVEQQPTAWGDFIEDCQQHGERPTAKTLRRFIDRRLRPKTPVEPEPDAPPLLDGKPEPPSYRILTGDCRDMLRALGTGSVQCVVTSPPYYGLRDYKTGTWEGGDVTCDHTADVRFRDSSTIRDTSRSSTIAEQAGKGTPYRDVCGKCGARRVDRQIGLEPTVEGYVAEMVEVFREVKRVLRDDGIAFVNPGGLVFGKAVAGDSVACCVGVASRWVVPAERRGVA